MGVGKSCRTRVLKVRGIHRRLTRLRVIKVIPTTQLIGVKSFTTTLTSHNRTMNRRDTVL
jgi:hypothetical protein